MNSLTWLVYVFFGLGLFHAGGVLLTNLGAGTVPPALNAVALRWTRAGRDPKWIRALAWLLFVFCAVGFLVFVVYQLYSAILQLGQKW